MATPNPGRRSDRSGFTLVEAVVALAILGLALLLELGAQWQSRAALEGLASEASLLRHAESTVESVRAGLVPLTSGPVDPFLAIAGGDIGSGESLALEVESTPVEGVCLLTVQASSRGGRARPRSVVLETQIWRPGARCD